MFFFLVFFFLGGGVTLFRILVGFFFCYRCLFWCCFVVLGVFLGLFFVVRGFSGVGLFGG